MRRARTVPFWVAVLTVALLGLLSPLAHACPTDPRWTAGSSDDSDLDDVLDLLWSGAAVITAAPTITAPRRPSVGVVAEGGAGCTSAASGSASPTRAPPALLAVSA